MTETSLAAALVRHRMLVLVVLGAVMYVAFLGQRHLWYPDEPDIGEVCRAMHLSGDWIVPRRNGQAWVDY
jgi:4-amino-4-deoxy-L-arabinose transferase-like glycosyltransferase